MKLNVNCDKYKRNGFLLLAAAAVCFFMSLLPLAGVIEASKMNGYILPALWGTAAFIIVFFLPGVRPIVKVQKKANVIFDAALCAIVVIAAQLAAGLFIYGFGDSPYDHSVRGIIFNIATIGLVLLGQELVRAYYIGSRCSRPNGKAFACITILMVLIDLNFNRILSTGDAKSLLILMSQEIGPSVCRQVLLSYLALYGGAAASFTYIGFLELYQKIIPVLPDYDWLAEGCIGIAVPLFAVLILTARYERSTCYKFKRSTGKSVKKRHPALAAGETVFAIAFLWFMVGVFPVYPSVIMTGSMEPLIEPGDLVLIEKIQEEEDLYELEAGDVIQFEREDILITHRIVAVQKDKAGNFAFYTKGDNNSTEDSQAVFQGEVRGTLKRVIPKLGLVKLFIADSGDIGEDTGKQSGEILLK